MFTMCYTRFSITDISLFRKSELRDEGGNKMGKIMAVNISEKKGTQKKNVHSARLMEEYGMDFTHEDMAQIWQNYLPK